MDKKGISRWMVWCSVTLTCSLLFYQALDKVVFLYGNIYLEDLYFESDAIEPSLITGMSILCLVLLVYLTFKVRVRGEALIDKRVSKDHLKSVKSRSSLESVDAVVNGLRERAIRLRQMSYLILVLLIFLLATGFLTFTRAEKTASLATSEVERLLENQRLEEDKLRNLQNYQDQLIDDSDRNFPDIGSNQNSDSKSVSDRERLWGTIKEIGEEIERKKKVIESVSSRISTQETPILGESAARFALSLLSTKIGAVLLLVFGAQILVSLYRYILKLAAFSDSRADVLQLITEKELVEEKLSIFLSSDQIEFVAKAETPSKQALKMAKDFFEVLNQNTSSHDGKNSNKS